MAVTLNEAYRFARWLSPQANLPSVDEWWTAAGFHEPGPPFRIPEASRLAIGLDTPRSVGKSTDQTAFGCFDMFGNGYERTRDLLRDLTPVPPPIPPGPGSGDVVGLHVSHSFLDGSGPEAGNVRPRPLRRTAQDRFEDVGFRLVLLPDAHENDGAKQKE